LASLFVGHAAQKSKLHNFQYAEAGNHMAEEAEEYRTVCLKNRNNVIITQLNKFQ
jgi:hypothetical protein